MKLSLVSHAAPFHSPTHSSICGFSIHFNNNTNYYAGRAILSHICSSLWAFMLHSEQYSYLQQHRWHSCCTIIASEIQCPVQLVGSFGSVEAGVGEGWPLSWLISLWCWPHSLSPDISRDWAVKLIQFRTKKLRQQCFSLRMRDFGIQVKWRSGNPQNLSITNSAFSWTHCGQTAQDRGNNLDLNGLRRSSQNVQLRPLMLTLFSLFPHQNFPSSLTSNRLYLWSKQILWVS